MTNCAHAERRDTCDLRPDGQLVRAVRGGHSEPFEVLMRRHNQRIYRTLRIWIRDDAAFPSLMQRVWSDAYSHLNRLDDPNEFSASLVRQAASIGQSQCRQRFLRGLTRTPFLPAPPPTDDPEATQQVHTPLKSVEQCIDALPTSTRSVFMLHEVEGLEIDEVAKALALSKKTVHIRLERGRRKIRRLMATRLNALVPKAFRLPKPLGNRVVRAVVSNIAPAQTLVTMDFKVNGPDDG